MAQLHSSSITGSFVTTGNIGIGTTDIHEYKLNVNGNVNIAGTLTATSISGGGNTILTTANYNSYAPTLTGGGASGTWGINVTGNSATTSQTNFATLTLNNAAVATQTWVTSQGITSGMVTTALGYTPVTNARTLTINGTAYDLSADRSWTIAAGVTSVSAGTGISVNSSTGAVTVTNSGVTSLTAGSGISVSAGTGGVTVTNTITNNNQLTNGAGYITGITSGMVTTALGYTPYNSSNPSSYITQTNALQPIYGDSGAYNLNVSGQQSNIRFSTGLWVNGPITGNYSHVLSFNLASDNRTVQMYLGDVPGYLWWRPNQGGTWHPWEKIWTSNNLTNLNQLTNGPGYITGITSGMVTTALGYTPYNSSNPSGYITGINSSMVTTALGYTPYNSTNPSGYITGLSFDGLSSKTGGSGTYQTSGDFRAPIFYDSNNTGYYLDPASGFVLNGGTLTTRTYLHQSGGGGGQNLFTGVDGPTSANGRAQFIMASAYSDLVIASSQANGSHGSTLSFTTYNPSNSGDYRKFVLNQGNWGGRAGFLDFGFADASRSNPHDYINSTDDVITLDGYSKRLGINNMNPGVALEVNGTGRASSDFRAPIFYDSNDTGYYLDPASTSNLNSVSIATLNGYTLNASNYLGRYGNSYYQAQTWIQLNGVHGLYAPSYNDAHWLPNTVSTYTTWRMVGSRNGYSGIHDDYSSVQISMYDSSGNGGVYREASGRWYWYHYLPSNCMGVGTSTTNSAYGIYVVKGGYFDGRVDGTIFYDANNTGYYTDPNSMSSMWGIAIRGDNSSTGTSNQIFFWGEGNSTTSAIGFKANGGSFGNPTGNGDGYNTYLTMDTNGRGWVFRRGVGGTDFGAAYTSGWILNNGIWQANDSMRSPIFYDSNDTGYYLDPASTSRLNATQYNYIGVGQAINTGYRIIVSGDYYANAGGNYWAEGRFKQYRGSGTWHDVIDSGNIGSQSVSYASSAGNATTANGANGNFYIDDNYGNTVVGVYTSTRYQGVFAMGDAYKLPADGTTTGNLYGIAWSHPNAGGAAGNLASHGMLILENGGFQGAWGGGSLRTPGDVRGTIFYDWNNTGYYCDPHDRTNLNTLTVNGGTNYFYGITYFQTNNGGQAVNNSDSAKLQAYSTGGNSAFMSFHRGGHYAVNFGLDNDNIMRIGGWSASANRWQLDMSGNNWAANSFRSTYFYDQNNTSYYGIFSATSRMYRIDIDYLYSYNWVYAQGDIVAYYSDERLKDKKGKIENAIDKVKQLNGFYYTNNDLAKSFGYKDEKLQVGLSAQEVQSVLPEVVTLAPFDTEFDENNKPIGSKSGEDYLTVNYDKLVPLLIEAIKEQQKQIDELKARLG